MPNPEIQNFETLLRALSEETNPFYKKADLFRKHIGLITCDDHVVLILTVFGVSQRSQQSIINYFHFIGIIKDLEKVKRLVSARERLLQAYPDINTHYNNWVKLKEIFTRLASIEERLFLFNRYRFSILNFCPMTQFNEFFELFGVENIVEKARFIRNFLTNTTGLSYKRLYEAQTYLQALAHEFSSVEYIVPEEDEVLDISHKNQYVIDMKVWFGNFESVYAPRRAAIVSEAITTIAGSSLADALNNLISQYEGNGQVYPCEVFLQRLLMKNSEVLGKEYGKKFELSPPPLPPKTAPSPVLSEPQPNPQVVQAVQDTYFLATLLLAIKIFFMAMVYKIMGREEHVEQPSNILERQHLPVADLSLVSVYAPPQSLTVTPPAIPVC